MNLKVRKLRMQMKIIVRGDQPRQLGIHQPGQVRHCLAHDRERGGKQQNRNESPSFHRATAVTELFVTLPHLPKSSPAIFSKYI
jgi:hypothetical protein